jgi:ABC-type transport system involved in cytochrome c biogenesis permease subunit
MVWLLYATYLHLRLILGWKGRKTAILSVIGFMLVIVAFFGRKLVPGGYHDYI